MAQGRPAGCRAREGLAAATFSSRVAHFGGVCGLKHHKSGQLAREWTTSQGDETWIILQAKDGSGKRISLALSETPVQSHPRIHLDLYAPGDKTIEVERLKALGATEVDWDSYRDDADFHVLADTEGNRFCVIDGSDKPEAGRVPTGA